MTRQPARTLCDFIDASPTAFHAAENMAAALEARGARPLSEAETWNLEPGGSYFVRRGGSALVAFRIGLSAPGDAGFMIAGAHTDSPGLKIRHEKHLAARALHRVPVEVYGAPILSGWFDRPLAVAGRVALRGPDGIVERLYNSGAPVGVVPNLAIHLNREINKGFEYSVHQHLPVLVDALGGGEPANGDARSWIMGKVAADLGIDPEAILGADLFFLDAQKCVRLASGPEGGVAPETTAADVSGESVTVRRDYGQGRGGLVNGPRLDDLAGCQAIAEAFIASGPRPHGQVACFLDAEEVGSRTAQGADSSFMRDVLARICIASGGPAQDFYRAMARSFLLSVDAAQAWHPAYPDKFDERFAPVINGGPALKVSANWRYATDAAAEAFIRTVCENAGVACQKYMSRADIAPGSTIGPMSSAHLGIRTADIGHPMLSMHAIRETIGERDHEAMIDLVGACFASRPSA